MDIKRRSYLQGASGLAAAAALGSLDAASGFADALAQSQQHASLPGLPSTMVWSVYDVGSTGYVEASAVADAFGKRYGSRVRLQPSGTSIGRLKPLTDGRANFGWLANELYFSSEALYEYCTPEWGPQDLRVLLGRRNSISVAATKTSGIREPKDLKGKRFAIARANSSANVKVEPILAFAGLTWDDLQLVEVPSYGASMKAMIEGRADCAGVAPAAAMLRELEASSYGIAWVELDPENKAGWERARRAVPFVEPFQETVGAGVSESNPVWMIGYRYPMITLAANASPELAYAMTRAVADTFELYRNASPIMTRWNIQEAGTPPMDAPFHEGAIRYLREVGVWNDKADAWQTAALKRHKAIASAWSDMMRSDPAARSANGVELQAKWLPRRDEVLAGL